MRVWIGATAVLAALAVVAPASAQPANEGQALFDQRCKSCHDPAIERAPNRQMLATTPAAQIVDALTNGVMAPMAGGLTGPQKSAIAAYLTAPQPTAAGGRPQAPQPGVDIPCPVHPPIKSAATDWTSQGFDDAGSRFHPNPGLTKAQVPRLKLKWAFAMSGGGMPTVVGDHLFVSNRNGRFYSLDAKSGCVHWVVDGVGSRTTPMVVKADFAPSGWATFIGLRDKTVRAFDAQSGKQLWQSPALDQLPAAGITGSPIVAGGQILVPLTSGEEGSARQDNYSCCAFRGSLAALDLKTGKLNWQTYMIEGPLKVIGRNSKGVALRGPAGAAIWSAPTVDSKRGLVYVATGDSYTDADAPLADAIVALDLKTGKVRWSNQVTANDNYIMGCPLVVRSANCPVNEGPDHDFGASPVLFTLKNGKDICWPARRAARPTASIPTPAKRCGRPRSEPVRTWAASNGASPPTASGSTYPTPTWST